MKNCILVLIIFLSIFSGRINAQQSIVVAGNSATGSGGSISYSVGQTDYVAFNNNTNSGVQQAYIFLALPVTLLNFSAVKQGSAVLLKWETANEVNSDHFVVERSITGLAFTAIGRVTAKGNSSINIKYTLHDNKPNSGVNYYRVKQVDKDGKFTYSAIAAINFEGNVSITCYPNPTTSVLNIRIGDNNLSGYSFQFTDMNGRFIRSGRINNQLTIISMAAFTPASYVLKILDGKGVNISFVIVKN